MRGTSESLIDADVDGPITDSPDELRRLLSERGFQLPAQHHLGPAALCRLIREDPANSRVNCPA